MSPEAWIALAGLVLTAAGAFLGGYITLVSAITRSRHTLRNEMQAAVGEVHDRVDRLEDRFNIRFGGD